jgi:excisionase family DNA binding protein
MLTVRQAARRIGRNPETVRRWIREGKLAARKIGTQHVIEERDLDALHPAEGGAALPPAWRQTVTGEPMPDVVDAVRRSRAGH